MVGDLINAEVGHVRHENAEGRGMGDGDVVQAYAVPRDDEAARCRVEGLRWNRLPVGENRIGVRGQFH
jgi:hypothetical protein